MDLTTLTGNAATGQSFDYEVTNISDGGGAPGAYTSLVFKIKDGNV